MKKVYNLNSEIHSVALFDFTGTLVNTEPLHHKTYQLVLDDIGIPFPSYQEYREKYAGKTSEDTFKAILSGREGSRDVKVLVDKRRELYTQLVAEGGVEVTTGAIDFLHESKSRDIKLGLVSTSRREEMQQILDSLEIQDLFDITIAREDVERKKPDPQGFILALEKLQKSSEQTVIFEDSTRGFEAAQSSGIEKCFGIMEHVVRKPKIPSNYEVIFIKDFTYIEIAN